jgi:hypothetical protein
MSAYSGVIFQYIGIAKKKKKGTQGFAKRLHEIAWATVSSTIFSTPPFGNCMGKSVIYFSPVKLLPAPENYTAGEHKNLSNV